MRTVKSFVAVAALVGGVVVGAMGAVASAATTPSCKPAQMAVSLGQSQGAAGTFHYPIIFTNDGGTCVIWGIPAIQPVVGAAHHKVGPAAGNGSLGETPARHTLAKGKSVSVDYAVIDTGNFSASGCRAKHADGVLVSLLPFVKSTYVKMGISVCTVRVSTNSKLIVPGKLGY
jgi:hypothetical protein